MHPSRFARLLPIVAMSSLIPVEGQILLTVSDATLQTSTSGQVVSISFRNQDDNPLMIYSGGFSIQVDDGVFDPKNPGSAPVITGVSFRGQDGSPFVESKVSFQEDGLINDRLYQIQFESMSGSVASPIAIPGNTTFTFASVTLATTATVGSWSLSIHGNNSDSASVPDPFFSLPDLEMADVTSVNGTLSAVPEPEETMAVMAGLSLGLGWWIRRQRAWNARVGVDKGSTSSSL
jgi:hypothetical protein